MDPAHQSPPPGSLSWRLSSHPITLLTFLFLRTSSLLVYLLGLRLLSSNFVLIFIITMLLLAIDFYYLKNIAGRRLVGLRWWNEVDGATGDGRWVFESADETRVQNGTDKRFFWIALYVQPVLWVGLAGAAVLGGHGVWLTLVGIALVLTITNTLAFSRCDQFSQAAGLASGALYGSGLARNLAGGMVSSWFRR